MLCREIMKRIDLIQFAAIILTCLPVFADEYNLPSLNRLRSDLRPVFESLGVTNSPVVSGQGSVLSGQFHTHRVPIGIRDTSYGRRRVYRIEPDADGIFIRAVLSGKPDSVYPRTEERAYGSEYLHHFRDMDGEFWIAVKLNYGANADAETVKKIKAIVERVSNESHNKAPEATR
jgi:hypothetical protein